MPEALYSLKLTRFAFPSKLGGNRANFRFLATVRYVAPKGKLTTESVVLPGLDVYWECDPKRRSDPAYCRTTGKPEIDFGSVDPWDRLILHMQAEAIHSMQIKVFDVDRRDAWDFIQEVLGDIVGFVLRRGRDVAVALPPAGPLPPVVPLRDAFGGALEDLEAWVLQKMAAQNDKLLFRGSHFFDNPRSPVAGPIAGRGIGGDYRIEFEVVAA